MAVSLSLVLSESDVNQSKNTSKVTAKLYATSTSGSYNSGSQSGYITIDGTKYTFNHSFSANTTTLLATKSKTVTHNSDGSKKVTVTGYYQTGVSSGNISTSKSLTLTTIKRIFSVHLNAKPGKVLGQDSITLNKVYGSTLTLPSAVRTGYNFLGWGSSHITKYSTNADAGYSAAWSEKTATVTYYNGSTKLATDTMKYSAAYTSRSNSLASKTGYHFNYWNTNPDGTSGSAKKCSTQIKAANVVPKNLTLYPHWEPNTHTVTFNTNGGTGSVTNITAVYNNSFTFPTYSGTKSNYIFKGWSTSNTATSPQYTAGQKITWLNTSANGSTIKYYAVWIRTTVAVNYYNKSTSTGTFSDKASYKKFTTASPYKGDNYKVSASTEDITNYKFSGYWKEGSPCNKDYTSYNNGVSLPIGVIPISYTPTSSDGFIQNNAYINNITSNKDLYAVYRDNTPSDIKVVASSFDYVSNNSNDTVLEYYKFLVGDNSNFQNRVRLQAKDFVASFKFTSSNLNIVLNENFTTTFTNILGNFIGIKRFVYKNGLDTYVIYTNETLNSLDEKETYDLVALNIKDNLGKTIKDSLSIEISPPNPIRDINATGTAISFFDYAPDDTHSKLIVKPNNWDTDWTDYYEKIDDEYIKLTEDSAPTFITDKYYRKYDDLLRSTNYLANSSEFKTNIENYIPSNVEIETIGDIDLLKLIPHIALLAHPIGSYYETSDSTFNPNNAWGGTWILETAGLVHVSGASSGIYTVSSTYTNANSGAGSKQAGNKDAIVPYHRHYIAKNAGNDSAFITGGGHTHDLSYTQDAASGTAKNRVIPGGGGASTGSGGALTRTHTHDLNAHYTTYTASSDGSTSTTDNKANANMMPYISIYRWHRTA